MGSTVSAEHPKISIRTALFLSFTLLSASAASAEPLRVFAAASLTVALDDALAECSAATGFEATGVYAGSGTLARQIEQGAPADLYISANPQWMDWLEDRGMISADSRSDLLGNRLVLIATAEIAASLNPENLDLPTLLSDQRLAVADTESVPAGIYAKQAFQARGWWQNPNFNRALVQAGNVREALSWVARGEAAFGTVYRTDSLREDRVEELLVFGASEHDPIRYPVAIVSDHETLNAKRLLACLKGKEAFEVFSRYGFIRAEE